MFKLIYCQLNGLSLYVDNISQEIKCFVHYPYFGSSAVKELISCASYELTRPTILCVLVKV